MIDNTAFQKVHRLNLSTRLLLIIPSLLLAAMFLTPFFLKWDSGVTIGEIFVLLFFAVCLPGFGVVYAISCRLVTTPDGIETFYWFPFHSFIPWNKIERIEQAPFNSVNMICAPKGGKSVKQVIPISTFVGDWQGSELVQDIKKYLPQINIPESLFIRKQTIFLHRSGTILIYFALSMTFVLIPLIFLEPFVSEEYKPHLYNANFGLMFASLGGMEGLLWFGSWRDKQTNFGKIKQLVALFYLLPFSGYFIVLLLSAIFYMFPFSENVAKPFVTYTVLILGFSQLRLFMRILGKHFSLSQSPQGEKQ